MSTTYTRDPNLIEPEKKAPGKDDRWFNALSIASIVTAIVMIGLLMSPSKYDATVSISFNPSHIEDHWDLLKDETRVVDFEGQIRSRMVLAPALIESKFKQGNSSFLGIFKREAMPMLDDSISKENMAKMIKNFQPYLKIERVRQSSLLRITVSLTSPEMAANTANAIVRSFFDLKHRQFRQKIQENLDAIKWEMNELQKELKNAMDGRNAFLKENGWSNYELELTSTNNRVSMLKQNLRKFESGNSLNTIKQLGQILPVTVSGNSSIFGRQQDPNLNQLIEKMNKLETRYLQTKSRFKEDSPPVLEVIREKKDLEKSIDEYILERKSVLAKQLNSAQKELQRLVQAGSKIQVFEVDINQSESGYQKLMNQRTTIRLQLNSIKMNSENFGALRILDLAIAPEKTSQKEKTFKVAISVIATFIVTFSLLMVLFEIWHQVSGHLALQRNKTVDPAEYFKKII